VSVDRPIAEDDLHGYVDGVLDAARRREVEAYLAAHPGVAARIAHYAAQRTGLREALAPIAEEPVPPDLNLTRLIAAQRHPRAVSWSAAAAAAVLCLFLGGGSGWILRGTSGLAANGLAALAQEAAISYEVFAPDKARPVEIRAADQDQLVRWVSNRLHRPMRVPDLAASGFRFIGGRLVATAHGPAGLYMYDDGQGARLAILVRPMEIEQTSAMTAQSDGPVAGFTWADGGVGYSLVATAATPSLHPLADEVRRQMTKPV